MTALRLCCYHPSARRVAFGAHTDTTFFTIVPFAEAPGLEVYDARARGWVCPEAAAPPRGGGAAAAARVLLMPGELLEVLTAGRVRAAVHRVVVPEAAAATAAAAAAAAAAAPRVSSPLLIRGARAAVVGACAALDGDGGARSAAGLSMAAVWSALQCTNSGDAVRAALREHEGDPAAAAALDAASRAH